MRSLNNHLGNIKRAALGVALSFGILWSSAIPASGSAWQNAQVPALQGIKSVAIVVSSHGDGAQKLGLNEAKLQNLIMQQISSAGIPLHSGGPIKDKPDVACFEIDTHLVIVEDTSTHRPMGLTYAIEGFILDSVATKRRAGISAGTLGILWKASGAHGYLPGEHIRSFGSIVQKVVNEFVQDYYTANGQKQYDAASNKQLPTISLSGQSETIQTAKNQVVSHMTPPQQATPLQRLIDEQNVAAPALTTYQKPREVAAARPQAAPPAAVPTPVAVAAPAKIDATLEEAIPEDELTSDQVALLQAKAQALHQQAINLQHQVLLQQISQLQSQAARLNERALARQSKKVDESTIQMLQAKQAALQKNIAAQTEILNNKPVETPVRALVSKPAPKKKLIAATRPAATASSPQQRAIADALVNQNSQIKTVAPVVHSTKTVRSSQSAIEENSAPAARPAKSVLPPQAVAPRTDVQQVKIAQTLPPPPVAAAPVAATPVQAQPLVAQKPVDSRPQGLSLAQMIAAQNAADSQQLAAIPYHQPAARPALPTVARRPAMPATVSLVKPATTSVTRPATTVTAKPVKPVVAAERDLAPRSGSVTPAQVAAKSAPPGNEPSVLTRARKKLLRLPWRSDAPTPATTQATPTKGRVL